jgi:hypothetical protein
VDVRVYIYSTNGMKTCLRCDFFLFYWTEFKIVNIKDKKLLRLCLGCLKNIKILIKVVIFLFELIVSGVKSTKKKTKRIVFPNKPFTSSIFLIFIHSEIL